MALDGLVAAALLLVIPVAIAVLWFYLEPGPTYDLTPRPRPVGHRACRGCQLAGEAGDLFLRRHLERECAA